MTGTPARLRRPLAAMIVSMTAGAMVALAPPATGAAGAAAAQAARPNVWRLVYRSHTRGEMTGIAAAGPASAWAVGILFGQRQIVNRLFVVHWDGKTWHPVTIPGGDGFFATSVEATSARNVWIFGQNDFPPFNKAVFRYDGARWHEMAAPSYVRLPGEGLIEGGQPLVLSASDAWMQNDFSGCTQAGKPAQKCASIVWHWNGSTWKSYTLGTNIDSLAGVAPGDVLAAGITWKGPNSGPGTTVVYRWNGTRWARVPVPRKPVYYFAEVGMDSARDVWIGAADSSAIRGFAMHWNGRRWTTTPRSGSVEVGKDVVPDGHGGVWLSGFGHWTGRAWIEARRAASITGGGPDMLVKIPRAPGSYWGAGVVTVNGTPAGSYYPGVMIYGPEP